jgi:UDP-4-amino-4,6-dideoxy-N-acetyl-beta-L-altrosamine N-acetyltransferase
MIDGKNIVIRAINQNDSSLILNWVNQPEIKYLIGTIYPVSDIEHEKWFQSRLLDKNNKMFGIQTKNNEQLVGIVGLTNLDFINRNCELYIYIGEKDYWGKGLGSEATSLIVKFAFEELCLHRVYLSVFSYNTRAIKAYEKVGFKQEGLMKDSLYKKGKYHDKVLMSIINNEENNTRSY